MLIRTDERLSSITFLTVSFNSVPLGMLIGFSLSGKVSFRS